MMHGFSADWISPTRSDGGLNNRIRVLQQRVYGYRDEECLMLEIIAVSLPPLPKLTKYDPR